MLLTLRGLGSLHRSSGSRELFRCFFSSHETVRCFLLLEGLDLKVWSFGIEGTFMCLFSSFEIFRCFLLVERVCLDLKVWSFMVVGMFVCLFFSLKIIRCFFSLKEKVWTWDVDLRDRGHVYMLIRSSLRVFNLLSSLLEEKVLILKAFLLERESLLWGRVLMGGLVILEGDLGGSG